MNNAKTPWKRKKRGQLVSASAKVTQGCVVSHKVVVDIMQPSSVHSNYHLPAQFLFKVLIQLSSHLLSI